MNNAIVKIWEGTKDGIKWFLIQAGVLLAISLLYYLGLYCYSLFSGIGFREILMSYPLLGRAGAYNWRTGHSDGIRVGFQEMDVGGSLDWCVVDDGCLRDVIEVDERELRTWHGLRPCRSNNEIVHGDGI